MENLNYYRQCAMFLAEAYGFELGAKKAVELSREAFQNGDMLQHFHWKFVVDYLEGPEGRRVSHGEIHPAGTVSFRVSTTD